MGNGKKICVCLRVIYTITVGLSTTKHPTSNYYFKNVVNIKYHLYLWKKYEDNLK